MTRDGLRDSPGILELRCSMLTGPACEEGERVLWFEWKSAGLLRLDVESGIRSWLELNNLGAFVSLICPCGGSPAHICTTTSREP